MVRKVIIKRYCISNVAVRYEGLLNRIYKNVKKVTNSLFPNYPTLHIWECKK